MLQVRRISIGEDTRVYGDVSLLGGEYTINHAEVMLQCVDGRHDRWNPAIGQHVHLGRFDQRSTFVT